ncbi:MAG TPA: transposase [Azospirillum sp.]|nr:transposase [Azospirillum sp.]
MAPAERRKSVAQGDPRRHLPRWRRGHRRRITGRRLTRPSPNFPHSSVVDLLPDRTAQTLTDWLKDRDTVTMIARDRSTEYARGSARGAPGAVQVADRWHLLQNLRQMVERWLAGVHGRLRRLPPVSGGTAARRVAAYPRSRAEAAATADSRARRHVLYEEVRRRFAAGATLLTISRARGLARGTVRGYAHAQQFPERGHPRPVS